MDQLWANRAASCRSRRRATASETALGDCREPSWEWWPGRQRGGTGCSARGTTGGRRTCWIAWSTRSCATRNRTGAPRSTARSAATGCATTAAWINSYYDDMAWLALALERAARLAGVERRRALKKLADQFLNAWVPEDGGGIPWRKQDQFFNAPANGPAGIFLARYGDRLRRAQQMARLDRRHVDRPGDAPGVRRHQGRLAGPRAVHLLPGRGARAGDGARRAHRCGSQGPARRAGASAGRGGRASTWRRRGYCKGGGGGDGGLFGGIIARYLALVATTLPGDSADDAVARDTARNIVLASAKSAWDNRQTVNGLPLFGAFWDRDARAAPPEVRGRSGGAVRRGRGQRFGDCRTGSVGAAFGLDADGGRL